MSDHAKLTLFETSELIRTGELTSTELVGALLDRISSHDDCLNAFVSVDREAALAAARARDEELRRTGWRGPLHGIPFAAKDIIDVAGQRTSCHSRLQLEHIAAQDAQVIARLRDEGAVLIGKTALHEFATGGPSFDLPWPPARNPWNPAVHPGGSSSGSGVAVSAGFVPLALGTDTAGSVRHPATVCGIVGIKPTHDAISTHGCFPLSFSLDCVGHLTRNVTDSAIALSCTVRPSMARKMGCQVSSQVPFALMGDGLKGMRIGVPTSFHSDVDLDPEIGAAVESAIRTLGRAGASIESVELSPLNVYTECGRTILQAEAFAIHAERLRDRHGDYGQRGRRRLLAGAVISASRYIRAQQIRTHLIREFAARSAHLDAVVCASSLAFACRIDDEPLVDATYDRQARTPFNVLGSPALAVPIGLSQAGLPIGVQIAGRAYGEASVYRAARGLERELDLDLYPSAFLDGQVSAHA
ncbi:MAG: amidase [Vicinamibacterales bacterium]